MNFKELAKERFSCRSFSEKAVEQEKLNELLEMVQIAPTAKNLQPVKIYVLQSPEIQAELDAITTCRYGAPLVLAFTYSEAEEWKNPLQEGIHSGVEDASIIASHVMLMATELGLDSVWVNRFANNDLDKILGIPADEKSVLFLSIGYRAPGTGPAPRHTETKPLDAMVKYL